MKKFKSPQTAGCHFFPPVLLDQTTIERTSSPETKSSDQSKNVSEQCSTLFSNLDPSDQLVLLSSLLQCYCLRSINYSVPTDFLQLLMKSMKHLQDSGRSNIFYQLAKAYGNMRPDGSDSVLPAHRMPIGLIEYCSIFYSTTGTYQVLFCQLSVFSCTDALLL